MSASTTIAFNDGAQYERMMGKWSQLVGAVFLDWLAPRAGLRWVDVGCGNGAFTEMIVERCAPSFVEGIDPSEGQLAFARSHRAGGNVRYQQGDATVVPFADQSFDVAMMALVLFFVPDPVKAVSEMKRVVRPGGCVTAYLWDITRGGSPPTAIWDEIEQMGIKPARPPQALASRLENLKALWSGASLEAIETREIVVERSYADFESYWQISMGANVGAQVAEMSAADRETLKRRVAARMPTDASGRISYTARANAIKGRRPA